MGGGGGEAGELIHFKERPLSALSLLPSDWWFTYLMLLR